MEWTAAVITVSDKGSRGERVDTSGPDKLANHNTVYRIVKLLQKIPRHDRQSK